MKAKRIADTIYIFDENTKWYRWESYSAIVRCKNRFQTAVRALLYGEIEITYQVRSDKKDKSLKLNGEKKGWQ